jgi:hypothetical protein
LHQQFGPRDNRAPRTDTPDSIDVPAIALKMAMEKLPEGAAPDMTPDEFEEPINDLQRSLMRFSEHLEQQETPVVPQRQMMVGPLSQEQLAKDRVQVFLDQQKAKAAGGMQIEP